MQVFEPFAKIRAILDGQCDQERAQERFFSLDDLIPVCIGFQGLSAPPDGAQWAKKVLSTE
jgi:hypothetical protein